MIIIIIKRTGTRLYTIWKGMRQRCSNPKASGYKNYGGKGICICEEWNNYNIFYEWAYNNGYTDELQIDRIDSDDNYHPENCTWVTKSINSANRNRDIKNRGFSKSKYTLATILEIQRLRSEGATYKQISEEFKCSISHAKRIVDNEIQYYGG